MKTFTMTALALLTLTLRTTLAAEPIPTPDQDFAALLDLGTYAMKPVPPRKDPKTGFVVGGTNETALIRKLTELNGRTIADLEVDMRPGARGRVGSEAGFLGTAEHLLDVLAVDNEFVVEKHGLSHQLLAKHLHALGEIAWWQMRHKIPKKEFLYLGRRYQVEATCWKGYQYSPFLDGTKTDTDVVVKNLDTGKEFAFSMLLPEMIARYGFYEGTGTCYRVEPRTILDVLDFLPNSEITPEGTKLAQLLDNMRVESLWKAGDLIEWESGKSIKPANDNKPHTHCSAFAAAVAAKKQISLLRPHEHSTVMLANAQADWLPVEGVKQGWKAIESMTRAQELANRGQLVVAVYREPGDVKSGHIAIVRPSEKSKRELKAEGPQIIQAGLRNKNSASLKAGFSAHPAAWENQEIRFYAHEIKW